MNSYEYSVAPENIDFQGHATIPSICNSIINAIGRNIRVEGAGIDVMKAANRSWVLLRSPFEIDERPRLYDMFNVMVWPAKGGGLTYNRCVKITNDDALYVLPYGYAAAGHGGKYGFAGFREFAVFWTADEYDADMAIYRYFFMDKTGVYANAGYKDDFLAPVRCVRVSEDL